MYLLQWGNKTWNLLCRRQDKERLKESVSDLRVFWFDRTVREAEGLVLRKMGEIRRPMETGNVLF